MNRVDTLPALPAQVSAKEAKLWLVTGKKKQLPLPISGAALYTEGQDTEQFEDAKFAVESLLQTIPTAGQPQQIRFAWRLSVDRLTASCSAE